MTLFWILFAGGLLVGLLGIDYYCKRTGRKTLSNVIHTTAKKYPVIAFFLGIVVGFLAWHFFVTESCYPL